MEIIHLILGKANPARMNGVNRVVNELATQQQQSGRSVAVWGFTPNPVHDYPARPYETRLFRAARQPFRIGRDWQEAMAARPDAVVHIHGGFIPRFYAASRFLRRQRIPYVLTPHGCYNTVAMQKSGLAKRLYVQLFEQRFLADAAVVHCLGKSEVAGLNALGSGAKTALIPYGYATTGDAPAGTPSGFTVGFCGRIDLAHKGLDRLVSGFANFQKVVPDAKLWIIGDGPQRGELEQQVGQLGLASAVTFWGSRFGEEKLDLLRQCAVFVHASRYEGLPVAVLEAASLGIPCLVSEATNVGDAVRAFDAGYVAQTGEAPEVTKGLSVLYQRLLTDQAGVIRRNARRMVRDEYNWEQSLQRFDQLYRQAWQAN